MPVTPVQRSLQEIAGGYSVFEQDQVLTAGQLNTLSAYAEDQTRLTRVRLLGVGVVCGLRPSIGGGRVRVSRGVGVTTDGDLLALDGDTEYDRWVPYDASRPAYPKLYEGGNLTNPMIPAFELVRVGAQVPDARALGTLAAAAGRDLSAMTAVLLMESYVRDEDLCSGTDCDNLGRDALHTPRLLLVAADAAGTLKEAVATPGAAFAQLPYVVAERPAIPVGLSTTAALAALYRTACATTHNRLVDALGKVFPALGPFLGEYFGTNPGPAWVTRLTAIQTQFAAQSTGIQYYYDFLRDVADTYNEFRDHVFGDATLCAPDLAAFPKHLLLGDLVPGADPEAHRTGFYPSPLTGRSAGEVDHAGFLLRKLDALLARFQLPGVTTTPIRVTPSMGEERPLEERAIPFYYQPGTSDPLFRRWSYALTRRGMAAHNYSYHAASYGAQGGAANPLGSQLGRFSFFRVEGHVGRTVTAAMADIQGQISARNLPFTVQAVLLDATPGKIVIRPPTRFSPIKRLHGVLRKDLSHQLEEVSRFSGNLTAAAGEGAKARVARADADRVGITEAAGTFGTAVETHAQSARLALDVPYAQYRANPVSWQGEMKGTLENSALMMTEIGHVTRNEFASPYDSIITNPHVQLLPWFDDLIDQEDKEQDERLLFSKFAGEHPQVEHFGGVERGGTLVLVYDPAGTVVADFNLPYHVHQEPAQEEPVLKPAPPIRPPVLVQRPVKFIPSREVFFEEEWTTRAPSITGIEDMVNQRIDVGIASITQLMDTKISAQDRLIDTKLAGQDRLIETVQTSYMGVFSDSLDIIKSGSISGTKGFSNDMLGTMVEEAGLMERKLVSLETASRRPGITEEEKSFYTREITRTQNTLAKTTEQLATYMVTAEVAVGAGTEGQRAVEQLGSAVARLAGTPAYNVAKTGVENVAQSAKNAGLKNALGGMAGF